MLQVLNFAASTCSSIISDWIPLLSPSAYLQVVLYGKISYFGKHVIAGHHQALLSDDATPIISVFL